LQSNPLRSLEHPLTFRAFCIRYLVLLVIAFFLVLATVLAYPSQLPWWAYIISILLALAFTIPCCMIMGITNIQLSLNVIAPYLAGFSKCTTHIAENGH
jgi:hypothetical protein